MGNQIRSGIAIVIFIFTLIFVLIAFGYIIPDEIDNMGLMGFIIVIVIIGISFYISYYISTETVIKVEKNVKQYVGDKQIQKNVNESLLLYQESKKNAQYLSSEFILQQLSGDVIDLMERLAFEEILVERGVLNSSPTHERLLQLKRKF